MVCVCGGGAMSHMSQRSGYSKCDNRRVYCKGTEKDVRLPLFSFNSIFKVKCLFPLSTETIQWKCANLIKLCSTEGPAKPGLASGFTCWYQQPKHFLPGTFQLSEQFHELTLWQNISFNNESANSSSLPVLFNITFPFQQICPQINICWMNKWAGICSLIIA